jgi:hypothetical protein
MSDRLRLEPERCGLLMGTLPSLNPSDQCLTG